MISLFPIPRRSLVSSSAKSPVVKTIRDKAWEITQWSESNMKYLLNYVSRLLHSKKQSNILVQNVIGSSTQIQYSENVAEGILVLWNIAAILSDSLKYFPIDDKKTRQIYKNRISEILKIFYSIQTEYLPSVKVDKKSDLNINTIAFFHTIYSAHFYEILAMCEKRTTDFLIASKYFKGAEKMNPFSRSKFPFNQKSIFYHIKAIQNYAKELESKLSIGPAIYMLNIAMSEFSSAPRDLRNSNTELENEIRSKLNQLEEDNKTIYFDFNKNGSLPEIEDIDETLHSGFKIDPPQQDDSNYIKSTFDEINERIDKIRNTAVNTSESISTFTTLMFECDSARKQINSTIFSSHMPSVTMIQGFTDLENQIEDLFKWLSKAKTSVSIAFDIDVICNTLDEIQKKLNQVIGTEIDLIEKVDAEPFFSQLNEEINSCEIPQSFINELAQETEKCFTILENLSSL